MGKPNYLVIVQVTLMAGYVIFVPVCRIVPPVTFCDVTTIMIVVITDAFAMTVLTKTSNNNDNGNMLAD